MKTGTGYYFVELYVGMGKMVAWWHQYALGFELMGKRERKGQFGMEVTYWLQKNNANLLVTSALEPAAYDVLSFVDRHGNSIKRFAIQVADIKAVHQFLFESKAIFTGPGIEEESTGEEYTRYLRCKLFDDNEIMFVEKGNTWGPMPGFKEIRQEPTVQDHSGFLLGFDHLASVVRVNESAFWSDYLCRLLNLSHVQTIGEEFFAGLMTGMKMNVLQSADGTLNKVVVEPLPAKPRKSQVDVFLHHHHGTGIQHMALEVTDLVAAVADLRTRGVKFTPVPDHYYTELEREFPDLPVAAMKKSNILCEKEGDKLLLQVFTEPIGDRPTLFYEFIQRVNQYDGFGTNNVRQLFKSLEVQLNGNA